MLELSMGQNVNGRKSQWILPRSRTAMPFGSHPNSLPVIEDLVRRRLGRSSYAGARAVLHTSDDPSISYAVMGS